MNKKVLIIEDDPIVAHIYKSRLEKEGYEVEIAFDGQNGYYRIHEIRPDVVLLDLMLPKMNGVDILKKIRAQVAFQKLPVIVFTNAYVANMIHESFSAGATAVYNKSTLTPRQIIDALNSALFLTPSPPDSDSEQMAGSVSEGSDQTADAENASAAFTESPAPSAARTEAQNADARFQSELLNTFVESAPQTLSELRKLLQDVIKTSDETGRLSQLNELYRKVHSLTGKAGIAGLRHISQLSSAVEVLVKELYEKPKHINASVLRTTAHALDFLGELFVPGISPDIGENPPINILVVDDEVLSRRAITYALDKALLKSVSVEDPQVALNIAKETSFDLIFLDVQMPGMDGFQLCERIRTLPANKNTPVIFVTSMTDFKVRAQSTLSGASDLIAKPFMFIELTVKALTFVLRSRIQRLAKV